MVIAGVMKHSAPKSTVERALEWGASLLFATCLAIATLQLFDPKVSAIAAAAGFVAALPLMAAVGNRGDIPRPLAPLELTFPEAHEGSIGSDDETELLLDDPLVATANSRVASLFAADAAHPAALVARIEDYLHRNPAQPSQGQEMRRDEPVPDASAALHSALANIRASLR